MSADVSNNHLPPQIVELLKRRGWTWPPTPEQRKRMDEAWERFTGSAHGSREVLKEIRAEMPGRLPDFPDEE